MRASLVGEYTYPDKQYADAAGNMQVLPNVFVGWDRALAISEFSHEGELLFDASLLRKNKRVERLKSLGSAPQDGFETAMVVRTLDPYVAVRAIHRSGRVLGISKPIET